MKGMKMFNVFVFVLLLAYSMDRGKKFKEKLKFLFYISYKIFVLSQQ
jgi:hypothetical protein